MSNITAGTEKQIAFASNVRSEVAASWSKMADRFEKRVIGDLNYVSDDPSESAESEFAEYRAELEGFFELLKSIPGSIENSTDAAYILNMREKSLFGFMCDSGLYEKIGRRPCVSIDTVCK